MNQISLDETLEKSCDVDDENELSREDEDNDEDENLDFSDSNKNDDSIINKINKESAFYIGESSPNITRTTTKNNQNLDAKKSERNSHNVKDQFAQILLHKQHSTNSQNFYHLNYHNNYKYHNYTSITNPNLI